MKTEYPSTKYPPTKIIFLDIDGVLNSNHYFSTLPKDAPFPNEIDPLRVKLLKQIVSSTGAKIVLSSTWRTLRDCTPEESTAVSSMYKYLLQSLSSEGLEIYDYTPEIHNNRPLEIKTWLKCHASENITSYISLDDDFGPSAYKRAGITNLVQTSFWSTPGGLQPHHVKEAISLLNGIN